MKQIMYIQFDRLFPNLFPIPGISVPFGAWESWKPCAAAWHIWRSWRPMHLDETNWGAPVTHETMGNYGLMGFNGDYRGSMNQTTGMLVDIPSGYVKIAIENGHL